MTVIQRMRTKEVICHECNGLGEKLTGNEWEGKYYETCHTCLGEGFTTSLGDKTPYLLIDPLRLQYFQDALDAEEHSGFSI